MRLRDLPNRSLVVRYVCWSRRSRFEGPLLPQGAFIISFGPSCQLRESII